MTPSPIGFIGAGMMGAAIVARLLDAGLVVVVHDRNPAAVAPLVEKGAQSVGSPRAVADAAKIVFSCLPSVEASWKVALAEDGVVHGLAMCTYVEMSTLGADAVQQIAGELRRTGVAMLDAPISGGPTAAGKGTLAIIVSGDRAAFDEHVQVLRAISQSLFYVGAEPGQAQICKIVNNAISITGAAIAYEAFVMGIKAGIDANVLLDVLNSSSGRNSATVSKLPAILSATSKKGASISILKKDMGLYLQQADRLGTASCVGSFVDQLLRFAIVQGGDEQEGTNLISFYENWAGVKVKRGVDT